MKQFTSRVQVSDPLIPTSVMRQIVFQILENNGIPANEINQSLGVTVEKFGETSFENYEFDVTVSYPEAEDNITLFTDLVEGLNLGPEIRQI